MSWCIHRAMDSLDDEVRPHGTWCNSMLKPRMLDWYVGAMELAVPSHGYGSADFRRYEMPAPSRAQVEAQNVNASESVIF